MGAAPTLAAIADAFGRKTAVMWLSIQFRDLSEYAGTKMKLSVDQAKDLASLTFSEHKLWKVTHVMQFLTKLKAGTYGKFFGAVDPIQIATAMRAYEEYRRDRSHRYWLKQDAERRRAEEERHTEAVNAHKKHLERLGITQEQWMENIDIFMSGLKERHLPEDEERRQLAERGVKFNHQQTQINENSKSTSLD